jgi:hypothetical protein
VTFLSPGRPNVRKLALRRDLSGLARAARYVEPLTDRDGREWDAGTAVRLGAVAELAGSASDEARGALIGVLDDADPEVRAAAVQALSRSGLDGKVAGALIEGIATWKVPPYAAAVESAVAGLIDSGLEEIVEYVAVRMVRAEAPLQGHHEVALKTLLAADARGETATRWVADCVCLYAPDSHADVGRYERAETIVGWLGDSARERIVERVLSGNADPAVIKVAGESADPRVIDPLIALLDHEASEVRATAATSLGRLRHSRAAEALIHATQDRDPVVRRAAAEAFDSIGMAAAIAGAASAVLAGSGKSAVDRIMQRLDPTRSAPQRHAP